jgi:predicted SnoaL-like aldol condensation-catalyzing enzyme
MGFALAVLRWRKPREAVEKYVGASYTQHHPHVADCTDHSSTTSSEWRERTPRHENGMF